MNRQAFVPAVLSLALAAGPAAAFGHHRLAVVVPAAATCQAPAAYAPAATCVPAYISQPPLAVSCFSQPLQAVTLVPVSLVPVQVVVAAPPARQGGCGPRAGAGAGEPLHEPREGPAAADLAERLDRLARSVEGLAAVVKMHDELLRKHDDALKRK
jgi:hypothetical protein